MPRIFGAKSDSGTSPQKHTEYFGIDFDRNGSVVAVGRNKDINLITDNTGSVRAPTDWSDTSNDQKVPIIHIYETGSLNKTHFFWLDQRGNAFVDIAILESNSTNNLILNSIHNTFNENTMQQMVIHSGTKLT